MYISREDAESFLDSFNELPAFNNLRDKAQQFMVEVVAGIDELRVRKPRLAPFFAAAVLEAINDILETLDQEVSEAGEEEGV
ncbi:MAG: hypothetical protein ACYSWU_00285 [Planctomycetota bacterium]|jgi:hypothetical protein